jgi:nucleoside-diphosphate-sugar epimerase
MAKPKAILVTGGAGYLGSVLVNTLLAEGHAVRVIDALCYGGAPLLAFWSNPRFQFVRADIRDSGAIRSCLHGMDTVVHLAAIVGDPACARSPLEAREVNLDASIRLFAECCDAKISSFILASTCSNYGMTTPSDALADEETALAPLSVYSQTKVECERLIFQMSGSERPAVTALRFATLFGASLRMRFDLTVNDFTMQLLLKKHLLVYAGGTWRPYIHVTDAARATCAVLAAADKVRGQIYNVGSTDQNYRKADIVELVQIQVPDATVAYAEKGPDPRNYRVSFRKLSEQLGFTITRTVSSGISEIVHMLQNGVISRPDDPMFRN